MLLLVFACAVGSAVACSPSSFEKIAQCEREVLPELKELGPDRVASFTELLHTKEHLREACRKLDRLKTCLGDDVSCIAQLNPTAAGIFNVYTALCSDSDFFDHYECFRDLISKTEREATERCPNLIDFCGDGKKEALRDCLNGLVREKCSYNGQTPGEVTMQIAAVKCRDMRT